MAAQTADLGPDDHRWNWDAEKKINGIRAGLNPARKLLITRVKGKHTGEEANKWDHIRWTSELPEVDVWFDGELRWGPNSISTMSVLGCLPDEALTRQRHTPVLMHCFDLPESGKTYRERKRDLEDELVPMPPTMVMVPYCRYRGREMFHNAQQNREEGIMLKDPMHVYQAGIRSRDWLKVKVSHGFKVVITGVHRGKGKYEGMMGALDIAMWDGERFVPVGKVGTGQGWTDDARKLTKWQVFQTIYVASSDLTEAGKLWHPRMIKRLHINPRDCRIDQLVVFS